MKFTLILIIYFFISAASYAQSNVEKKISIQIQLDTVLIPDYYEVKIGLAEYLIFEGRRRHRIIRTFPLDSLVQKLDSELIKTGIHHSYNRSPITLRSNDYGIVYPLDDPTLFEVTIQLKIANRDSVEYLFKNLKKYNLKSFLVTPRFNSITIEKVKGEIIDRGKAMSIVCAQEMALDCNQKIIKQSIQSFHFYPHQKQIDGIINDHLRIFVVDLRNQVEFTMKTTYVYFLDFI